MISQLTPTCSDTEINKIVDSIKKSIDDISARNMEHDAENAKFQQQLVIIQHLHDSTEERISNNNKSITLLAEKMCEFKEYHDKIVETYRSRKGKILLNLRIKRISLKKKQNKLMQDPLANITEFASISSEIKDVEEKISSMEQ